MKSWLAVSPPGLWAVTVTAAPPAATAVTVKTLSATDTAATPESDDTAEYTSLSPLGSVKHTATMAVSPARTITSGMEPQAAGGSWFSFSQVARASRGRAAKRFIIELLLTAG